MDNKEDKKIKRYKKYETWEIVISVIIFFIGGMYMKTNEDIGTIIGMVGLLGIFIFPWITRKVMKINVKKIKKEKQNFVIAINTKNRINLNDKNWIQKHNNFYINQEEKKILINKFEYNFKDIIDYELLIDGTSVSKASMGSALTKTLLFGSIIGGTTAKRRSVDYCTELKIKISLNDFNNPVQYIDFLEGFKRLPKNNFQYKNKAEKAQELMTILKIITINEKK